MKTKTTALFLCLFASVAFAAADETADCCAAPLQPGHAALGTRSLYRLGIQWTADNGQSFRLASLQGSPVVLAMFFSHCEYACPTQIADMQRLRERLPAAVRSKARFVLVSFDAQRDTPAALRAYRRHMSLDASWTLLHGDAAAVQELAMVLGVKYRADAQGQFAHSNSIAVLNSDGDIVLQHAGLNGDMTDAAKAVIAATE